MIGVKNDNNNGSVGGYAVSVDPMDLLQCDACQQAERARPKDANRHELVGVFCVSGPIGLSYRPTKELLNEGACPHTVPQRLEPMGAKMGVSQICIRSNRPVFII